LDRFFKPLDPPTRHDPPDTDFTGPDFPDWAGRLFFVQSYVSLSFSALVYKSKENYSHKEKIPSHPKLK
jgi:hypothetical protein